MAPLLKDSNILVAGSHVDDVLAWNLLQDLNVLVERNQDHLLHRCALIHICWELRSKENSICARVLNWKRAVKSRHLELWLIEGYYNLGLGLLALHWETPQAAHHNLTLPRGL